LRQDQFAEFVIRHAPEAAMVADLACGTGESARPLLKTYANITLIDQSEPMLQEAGRKFPALVRQHASALDFTGEYDLITMRQAFNYIPVGQYGQTFDHIFSRLLPGGMFIFNTFSPMTEDKQGSATFENGDYSVESSWLWQGKIHHLQLLTSPLGNALDYNVFQNTDLVAIESTLDRAGFIVRQLKQGKAHYFCATRP
jgi:ubiquinone/menaquinone biosynthesis C-methylase UbiE